MRSRRAVTIGQVFHALGDPTRRSFVERLSKRPCTVSELAEPLNITLTAVVQHLRVLELARLIRTEKQGRTRTCQLEIGGLKVLENWNAQLRSQWERRLDRLGDLLEEG